MKGFKGNWIIKRKLKTKTRLLKHALKYTKQENSLPWNNYVQTIINLSTIK